MTDVDELLGQLGALEREEREAHPHAWEDVVRGIRTAAEVRREREGIDDPEDLAALSEQLTPLSDAERNDWIDRLTAMVGDGTGEGPSGEGGEGDDAGVDQGVRAAADGSDATKADADPVRAEPFEAAASVATGGPDRSGSTTVASLAEHRRRRTTWGVAAFGMVAAALLAVWIIPSGPLPVHDADAMADAQLPRFELVARNDTVQTVRKGPEATDALPRYRADTRVQWIIRPARKVSSTLALRLLATPIRPTTGERQLIDPGPIVVSEEGVIELRGVFGETVGLSPGRWSVEAVVGGVVPVDIAMYDAGGSWVTAPAHPLEVIP